MKQSKFYYFLLIMEIVCILLLLFLIGCMIYFWSEHKHLRWIPGIIMSVFNIFTFHLNRKTEAILHRNRNVLL